MTTGNIDEPAICKECGVTTTLDSVQQICWECWIQLEDEEIQKSAEDEEMDRDHRDQNPHDMG
jgi:hypothetical protein